MAVDRAVCSHFLQPPNDERGFALLLVLLLAAAVAFSLYTQIPRVGFESMREKEQLLMDRGNQYKRAIQVFYAVNHRYPARIEELENTNEKRFLRRRYKDPLTGKDEWRLIHTNGSFLTDSLVQKPPAQNAANGTPGTGILPGGGPLGTNNMNSQPAQGNAPGLFGNNPAGSNAGANPDGTPQAPALNPAAQRRPSDRLIPGDGTTVAAVNQQQGNGAPAVYPPGYNPATFNPNDPSTWPPITLAPVNAGQAGQPVRIQNGQPPQPGQPAGIPGFGGQLTGQPSATQFTPQPFGQTQPFGTPTQPVVPSQLPAQGQQYPGTVTTPLPFGPQQTPGSDGSTGFQPFPGQTNTPPTQTPSGIPGQSPGQGGANPQPSQIFNPGFGFSGNPLAPNSGQQAGSPAINPFGNQQVGGQQLVGSQPPAGIQQTGNPAGQQNPTALNPALQAINTQLSSPGGTPAGAANPQAAPGIAGVASTFEGVGIKVYNKRSKYKEWEFVFDPAAAGPANQQLPGQPGQNPSAPGQAGATPSGSSGNLFGQTPNPFAPNSGQTPNSAGQTPTPAVPAASPFAPAPNPFGQGTNPFGPATQ